MEIIEIIKEAISNVGFPIACACLMFYQMEEERKSHAAESEKWVEALNRNTSVMERIMDKLGVE